ncbi:hypothetical protein HBH1_02944 [Herbaspirillum sp. BH-1]|uniref:Uncharacterized protein n=1 Tax=Herbaspirillum frisingense TaxID=92645 RepID=A0ABU1PCT4_9BURK|nr:hypothetical protein [Herbaspirillum frisingense]PLY58747.1 hypothetical protein HBH1_02944 [Herbaspirillum sp. BH-1]
MEPSLEGAALSHNQEIPVVILICFGARPQPGSNKLLAIGN